MSQHKISESTQTRIDAFEQADKAFRAAWDDFEQKHQQELEYLDKLREERNVRLDEAKRVMRDEAAELDITKVKFLKAGPFSVQKKWSGFYLPEKFVAMLEGRHLYDQAVAEGAVREITEVPFEKAKAFLESKGLRDDFAECEDGKELTPAVTGPKPIGGFGAESKEK